MRWRTHDVVDLLGPLPNQDHWHDILPPAHKSGDWRRWTFRQILAYAIANELRHLMHSEVVRAAYRGALDAVIIDGALAYPWLASQPQRPTWRWNNVSDERLVTIIENSPVLVHVYDLRPTVSFLAGELL